MKWINLWLIGGIILTICTGIIAAIGLQNTVLSDPREKIIVLMLLAMVWGMVILCYQLIKSIRKIRLSENDLILSNEILHESENRFRSAFDSSAIGMALVSPSGQCFKVNDSMQNMLGYTSEELLTKNLQALIHPEDYKKDFPYINDLMEGKIKTHHSEQRFYNKKGEILWILSSISLISDGVNHPLYFIVQLQNITAEKNAEEQLRQLAYYDGLTGLANRTKLEECLNEVLSQARRHTSKFAVIFLDLDHFKNINDTMGHETGDLLLQVIGNRLKATIRATDVVARLGGDEFVVILTDMEKLDDIAKISQKILSHLLQPIIIKGNEIYVTMSMGISFYPYDGEDVETLMKNADLALYRAKEQGRNNYQFCTPEMTARSQEKMIRQNALAHALVKDEFLLFYQPKIDLVNRRINGVEALLRWKNPKFKMVTPDEIIALAEETGLIIPLGDWVLKTACQQVKSWQVAGFTPLNLAINLSSRQLKKSHFVEETYQILKKFEFDPTCLEFEITESFIMQDPENVLRILLELKKLGIQIAIDDFGTGYSSLSYLKQFAVDKIKIDKTFIHRLTTDETSISIVTAMIAMANKLGIKTIAEGVETQKELEFLIKENCSEVQGYYLSQPLSSEDMMVFLHDFSLKANKWIDMNTRSTSS